MLMEHDQGRVYVRAMEAAAQAALAGKPGMDGLIAENAISYLELLREHIAKEDDILYPLAERLIPEGMREEILEGYAAAEVKIGSEFAQRYLKIVESYEKEATAQAA